MSRGHFISKSAGVAPTGHGRRNYLKEEELIVRRRNAELEHYQLWTGVNDYFKTWDVRVNQFSNWASPEFFNSVSDNRLKEIEAQKRKENLDKRRQQLLKLLTKEEVEYKEEIKNLQRQNKLSQSVKVNEDNLCHMNLEFMRRADETIRRENELKLYHHYTFPRPDQFRKQYAYFSKRAEEEKKDTSVQSDYKNSNLNKNWDMIVSNDKLVTERELIKSSIIKVKPDIERRMKELEKIEEKKRKLKSEEAKRLEEIFKVTTYFKELMKEDGCKQTQSSSEIPEGFSTSAIYLERWRTKSKNVQNELKQQIKFLDSVHKVAELVKDFPFKYEIEKRKQAFLKKLQMESGRERLSNLFECTYREPSIWWKEESKMWNDDKEERKTQLEDIYSKLEAMEENWNHKNLQEQKHLIANQESIMAELERFQKDIESNEQLLEQLRITI